MLNTANLSLDQAPPISIPFRYFVTAPLFGLLAGLLVLVKGPELFLTRWSPMTLGLTHLLTLGFLALVMCGALLQMLPVIVGSPVPAVTVVGPLCHILLVVGTALLVTSFLSGTLGGEITALVLLGGGVVLFSGAVMVALWRIKRVSATAIAMRLALISLFFTLLLGVLLGSGLIGSMGFASIAGVVNIHLGWGLLGWVGLLLIGISYQVVPMFQVTPEYPQVMQRWLAPGIFVGLLVWSLFSSAHQIGNLGQWLPKLLMFLVVAGFCVYALATLRLQKQRKRRIPDITLSFWRIGMLFVLFSAALWVLAQFAPSVSLSPSYPLLLGVALLMGVGVSVINGMIYKIVPFLSWFHLQNRQMSLMCMTVAVPNMKQFISDKAARLQYRCFLGALILSMAAVVEPAWFARPAGLLFVLSNLLLLRNLSVAMARYRSTNSLLLAEAAARSQE